MRTARRELEISQDQSLELPVQVVHSPAEFFFSSFLLLPSVQHEICVWDVLPFCAPLMYFFPIGRSSDCMKTHKSDPLDT